MWTEEVLAQVGKCKDSVVLVIDESLNCIRLAWVLMWSNIEYSVQKNDGRHGLKAPYLIVNGAPLDWERSVKWIEEQQI